MSPRSFLPFAFLLAAGFGAAAAAEATCIPVVTGNKAGEGGSTHAQAYDGNADTAAPPCTSNPTTSPSGFICANPQHSNAASTDTSSF